MIVADFNLIIGLLKHFYSPQIILLFQPWPSSSCYFSAWSDAAASYSTLEHIISITCTVYTVLLFIIMLAVTSAVILLSVQYMYVQ